MKTALLFSGQGSQYVGMLKDVTEKYPRAKQMVEYADSILGYSLSSIYFDGPVDTLKETRYTQPSLFVHSAVVQHLLAQSVEFEAVAGHSVGEYAALFAAGVLKFEDALRLVSLRGELMFKAGETDPGTMFAVVGLPNDKVEALCEELTAKGNGNVVVAANYNAPGQVVVSGSRDYLRENAGIFKENGAKMAQELVVSGAFHSPPMLPAKEELEKAIREIAFRDAVVPIYSNVYATPLVKAEEIKESLILQLTMPVKWTQSLEAMQQAGFAKFIEMGPSKVLQGLVKRTLTGVEFSGVDKAEDVEALLK